MSKEATARSAMKLALEGAANYIDALGGDSRKYRQALAEQPAPVAKLHEQEPVAIHQFRSPHCSDWYDGVPDHHDGHGPYEVRTLYASPPPQPNKPWVEITPEELMEVANHQAAPKAFAAGAAWANAKLQEKNT